MRELTSTQKAGWAFAQKMADANLHSRPRVEVIRVIEVTFLRGKGDSEADPVRLVIALYRADGTPIVEIDPHMADT